MKFLTGADELNRCDVSPSRHYLYRGLRLRGLWTYLGSAMSDVLDILGNVLRWPSRHSRDLGIVILFAAILLF